jgi:hypothetical protein
MNKSALAALATMVLWAGGTLGQEQAAPAQLPPEKIQAPAAPATVGEEVKSCFGEWGAAKGCAVTADLDYVLWFLANSRDTVPLATTQSLGKRRASLLGSLADAEHQQGEPGSGAYLALGVWEMQSNPWLPGGIRDLGAETTFFFVGQRSARFVENTSPSIVRPFFDVNNRQESAFVVAAPGLANGSLAAHSQADVWGAEANVWKSIYCDDPGTTCTVSVMAGFRFLDLDERLDIDSISVFNHNLAAFPTFRGFEGNTLQVSDAFVAHNHFYGGQVGITGKSWIEECLFLEGTFKVGIGETVEDLEIAGAQVRQRPHSRPIASPGGLLALPSNMGSFRDNKFAQVPELDLKLLVPLTSHWTFSTGFSTLYWSRVLRPGEQVDRALDITQIHNFPPATLATPSGLNQPGVPFRQSDLWVLGIHVGLEFTY